MQNQNDTPKPDPAEQPSPEGLDETICCAIVDAFRDALRRGKLQQRIHDEWVDVDTETIPVGYVVRAHHWRIIPHNVKVHTPLPAGAISETEVKP